MNEYELQEARGSRIDMESHAAGEDTKKQSPLRVIEVDFVFSLTARQGLSLRAVFLSEHV